MINRLVIRRIRCNTPFYKENQYDRTTESQRIYRTTAASGGSRAIVKEPDDYVKAQPKTEGPKKVLVIGASMATAFLPALRRHIPAVRQHSA